MPFHRPKLVKKWLSTNVSNTFATDVKTRISLLDAEAGLSETEKQELKAIADVSFDKEVDDKKPSTDITRRSYVAVSSLLGVNPELAGLSHEALEEIAEGDEELDDIEEVEMGIYNQFLPFESVYRPEEMRCLALIAHNCMKPALKKFVQTYHQLLRKFRLTGTASTMRMVRNVIGDDPSVKYGPTCTSGPLGGDAQLSALMCMEDLGGAVFFIDPLTSHPHQADIDSLTRLANVHNIIIMPNPASACAMCYLLRDALEKGYKHMISSFFNTLESPAVAQYKLQQDALVKSINEEDNE